MKRDLVVAKSILCLIVVVAGSNIASANMPIGPTTFGSTVPPFGGFPGKDNEAPQAEPLADNFFVGRDPEAVRARLIVPRSLLPGIASTDAGHNQGFVLPMGATMCCLGAGLLCWAAPSRRQVAFLLLLCVACFAAAPALGNQLFTGQFQPPPSQMARGDLEVIIVPDGRSVRLILPPSLQVSSPKNLPKSR